MSSEFSMSEYLSAVVGEDMEVGTDQLMDVQVNRFGVMSIKMFSKEDGSLISRIAVALHACKAVETFSENGGKFFQVRADGGNIPVLFSQEKCKEFMECVEALLGPSPKSIL